MSGLGNLTRRLLSHFPAALMRLAGRPAAVFFHGVEARIEDPAIQSNHHDADAFAEIARFLRDNFNVLPLADISGVLRDPGRFRNAVFLMCDDGYANNLAAADVLAGFGLPWTLFVSTRHIGTGVRSPVFVARLFFHHAPEGRYDIAELGPVSLNGGNRAEQADLQVARLRAFDAGRAERAIAQMQSALSDLPALLDRFRSDAFLDWDHVRALSRRGVEIGAHADLHWPMHGGQTAGYLQDQARLAREKIEAEVGRCRYFAYPFGNVGDICPAAWRAVRDAGYEYAFTTLSGSLDASLNPFLMPRYGLALREPRLPSVIAGLRLGNGRLRTWQRLMAR
jgi:peptidoglycan/xylan/chitin deacetylase (PgdA/CDA1 family)